MYLGVLLKRIWYKAVLAKTATEGIHVALNNVMDLIVFDADISGPERDSSVSLLRSDPAMKNIPLIVFITEKGPICETLINRGCSAVITKPLDVALVYRVLARLSGQERQAARVPVVLRVEVAEYTAEKYLTGINISEGGMYIRTVDPFPEGKALHLKFTLPRDTETIKVTGEVTRTEKLGPSFEMEPGMALRFVDLSEEDQLRIRNFIQWELTEDLKWEANI